MSFPERLQTVRILKIRLVYKYPIHLISEIIIFCIFIIHFKPQIMKNKKSILSIFLGLFIIQAFGQEITQLGSWNNNANFTAVYHHDRIITSTTSGIIFLDVSDPENPVPNTSLPNPSSFPTAIEIGENHAYFGGGMTSYFMIADISNLSFPVQKGIVSADIFGTAHQIAVKDDHAFMPTSAGWLYAFDISDVNNPLIKNVIAITTFASGIVVRDNYAYVGTNDGLKVIDISNPGNLNVINSFGGNYRRISPDFDNDRLFVAKASMGFDVIDISDPENPAGLFQGIGGSSEGNLVYQDGFVFQVGPLSVSAFEIGESSATYLASFNTTITGQVNDVTVKDSVFYLSTVYDVHVLKLSTTTTGLNDLEENQNIRVYPNPAQDYLIIEMKEKTEHLMIEIYNGSGQLVKQDNTVAKSIELDLQNLETGVYIIHVTSGSSENNLKFIKE